MILQALVKYCEQLENDGEVGKDGWSTAKVSYALTIDSEGHVRSVQSLMIPEKKRNKETMVPSERGVPLQKGRTCGKSPYFMCDNAKYLLGAWKESDNEEQNKIESKKAREYFRASAEYHLSLLEHAEGDAAKSVSLFFKGWDYDRDKNTLGISAENLLSAKNLIFRSFETSEEQEMLKRKEIAEIWDRYYNQDKSGNVKRCLVTGKTASVARIHPLIKGVRDAQTSGAALVSFNAEAFESYGKNQGDNAPVSEYAANAYGKALNYLLGKEGLHRIIGDTTIVYWAETGEEEYGGFLAEFLDETDTPEQDKLIDIMKAVSEGKSCRYKEIDMKPDTKFYILGLSPNAARLSVRFFYQGTFGNMLHNIEMHYNRMKIIKPSYAKEAFISINKVLNETVNKNASKKKVQPMLVGGFMNAILNDTRYPESVYVNIMIRIRADKDVNYRRAAMLKAFLIKNKPMLKGVIDFMELNENTDNLEYVLGRLFAVLEDIQYWANGDLNTTIKDKFFISACATPASVFPRLLKLSVSHMRVLKRDKTKLYVIFDKQMTELINKIKNDFPKQLSLDEQGTFIIGYYHQKRYEKKENKSSEGQGEKINVRGN